MVGTNVHCTCTLPRTNTNYWHPIALEDGIEDPISQNQIKQNLMWSQSKELIFRKAKLSINIRIYLSFYILIFMGFTIKIYQHCQINPFNLPESTELVFRDWWCFQDSFVDDVKNTCNFVKFITLTLKKNLLKLVELLKWSLLKFFLS